MWLLDVPTALLELLRAAKKVLLLIGTTYNS
jgi:hypothetical protein